MTNIKHIYYINLDRRNDRWEEALKKINDTCLKDFEYTRFSAFDGLKYEEELPKFSRVSKYIDLLNKQINDLNLQYKKGELGCMISHLTVLNDIATNENYTDDDYFCIFEDDFFYSGTEESFNNSFNQLNNTDLKELKVDFLYIGGRFKPNFHVFNENLYKMTDNIHIFKKLHNNLSLETDRCLTAYMVNKKICLKLINFIVEKIYYKKNKNNIFDAVDSVVSKFSNFRDVHDYFPHLFYSPRNYKTDIQLNN